MIPVEAAEFVPNAGRESRRLALRAHRQAHAVVVIQILTKGNIDHLRVLSPRRVVFRIPHQAHDLDLLSRIAPHAEAPSNRVLVSKIMMGKGFVNDGHTGGVSVSGSVK